jgi:hypothetical protein
MLIVRGFMSGEVEDGCSMQKKCISCIYLSCFPRAIKELDWFNRS